MPRFLLTKLEIVIISITSILAQSAGRLILAEEEFGIPFDFGRSPVVQALDSQRKFLQHSCKKLAVDSESNEVNPVVYCVGKIRELEA